ncbi:MAG: hypothetical protein IPK78_19845 [Rhodospirillales bacterium]|nr:hypothetical protein [Rhodospirillales bacterium]
MGGGGRRARADGGVCRRGGDDGTVASAGSIWPETPSAWLLVAGALVSSAMLALGPLATVGRRKWIAAVILAPVWVVCAGYSLQSIVKFAAE